ncbi:MAG: hypothetical protein COA57_13155 [Flavobacteriales bacterium]|nr:MAG: hypothetical protein COA57_13155 [Flavobacteriales bacterium]
MKKGIFISLAASVFALAVFSTFQKTQWERNLELLHVHFSHARHVLHLTSPIFEIDTIYKSMAGPNDTYFFNILEANEPELLWITGFSVEIIGENAGEDFLCHNNLDYSADEYFKKWNLPDRTGMHISRLATLTQGLSSIEFPGGFGIPLMSDEDLSTAAQVMNHNLPNVSLKVKHAIRLEYVPEKELKKQLKPLFQQSIAIMPLVDKDSEETSEIKNTCSPALASIKHLQIEDGNIYTGHWIVKPGREIRKQNITNMLNLPFSTTVHYIAVHAHPFVESLELRDITADTIVFKSFAENFEKKTGLKKLGYFSSEEGIMLYRNHEYELICTSSNTSGKEQDMMAVMLLYLYDKQLEGRVRSILRQ